MPVPDSSYSTLGKILTKIRRLTRSPSQNQISDNDLIEYVNTFILYDMPARIRQSTLHTTLSFWTDPYIDVYETNTTNTTDPLYNFRNRYTTVNPPAYIAGFEAFYSQSETQFFATYPKINQILSIGVAGDGVTTAFNGTIPLPGPATGPAESCLVRNNVLFSSVDINGDPIALIDNPINATTGDLVVPNDIANIQGAINYITGQFVIVFAAAPGNGQPINSQAIPQSLGRPQSLLFYDNKFTVRPIPDQPYRIDIQAYIRPSEMLNTSDEPELAQWWEYIAYGASKKVFEDRSDMDSVSAIIPEFENQQTLIERKTIVQQTNQRVATIYQNQSSGSGSGNNNFGNGTY